MTCPVDALLSEIRASAARLGLPRIGFVNAERPLPRLDVLVDWLARGYAGEMAFLHRRPEQRVDVRSFFPPARTVIVALASYAPSSPPHSAEPAIAPTRGLIARYARGRDYHEVLGRRLSGLHQRIEAHKIAVDTAPLLERELAAAAGLGFIGKNCLLISPGLGSYTVIGSLLLDLPLPTGCLTRRGCGRCDLCIRACPTGALVAPYRLDARRCLSYLTVEHRGPVPEDIGERVWPWLFGCDRCQEVCPHNARAGQRGAADPDLAAEPTGGELDLAELVTLRSGAYRRLVKGRALRRAPRHALRRNAALAAASAPGRQALGGSSLGDALQSAALDQNIALASAARQALARLADLYS
jgi:epoxyqueuosine reductase